MSKNPVVVGQWIQIQRHRFEGFIGYVLAYDFLKDMYNVRLVRNAKNESVKIQTSFWFIPENLAHAEPETLEGTTPYLINLALDTRDRKWFEALSKEKGWR